ncbi:hypothetical protein GCM10009789_70630 [Kribbella sancticallisti]|uniref:Uncharacterized protein n=1 Tax=Kribbella sancticallisti TaxID=460087 RepID=A0ABN2EG24_9ACTN
MIPMGFEFHLTPGEQAVLLVVLGVLAVTAALPVSCVLAWVGARRAKRAGRPGGTNGFWYWLWGTALSWAVMIGAFNLHLGWWSIPIGWLPGLAAAALLRPRGPSEPGPQALPAPQNGQGSWTDPDQQSRTRL